MKRANATTGISAHLCKRNIKRTNLKIKTGDLQGVGKKGAGRSREQKQDSKDEEGATLF